MQEIMPVSNELRVMLAAAEPEIQQYVLALQTKITQLLAHNGKQEVEIGILKHKLKHYEPLEKWLDRLDKFIDLSAEEKQILVDKIKAFRNDMKKENGLK
jgi:hypothetical protein